MAWNVDQIYGFSRWLCNKNQAGGISATDLFYMWNSEQSAYQSDLLGRFQARSNGKEGMNTGLIENATILTKLTPFIKPATLTIALGIANKPADFIYKLALRINGSDVVMINKDQIATVNASVIDPPLIADNKYYATEYLNYYSFLPNTVTSADLDYVCIPTDIAWGWTPDPQGRQTYAPGTSAQPQWAQNDIVDITKRALKGLGIHFKDQDFAQFGNSNIVTGD